MPAAGPIVDQQRPARAYSQRQRAGVPWGYGAGGAGRGEWLKYPRKIKRNIVKKPLDKKILECYSIDTNTWRCFMKARELIKVIMEKQDVNNACMADRLNITQAALWDRLNTKKAKDIPVSMLSDMLRALDYKVVLVPRSSRVPTDGYEVE
jgi:DNA-binding Xre family transcriptional regulator